MRYQLVVRVPGAGITSRLFEAVDRDAACARARAEGLQVVDAQPAGGVAGSASATPHRREPARARLDTGVFAEELGTLLQAGLGMLEAIDALSAGQHGGAGHERLAVLARHLREGRSLSDAMAEAGGFPLLLVANVKASERTGNLVQALLRHAEYDRQLQALRASLLGAATYPLLLLAVGTVVVLFLLGFVIPRFAVLIESSKAELPWSSRLLMSFGATLAEHPMLPVVVLALFGALAVVAVVQVRRGRAHALLQRLPVVGRLARAYRLAQTYRMAGLLVRGGVPAVPAFEQSGALLQGNDRGALAAAVLRMREGQSLSQALGDAGLADAVTARMLIVAERTGTLADVLDRIALIQETRLQRALGAASRLAEPVLMIGIGLVIGAIVVLMYLPIFDLAAQLQ